MPRAPMPAWVPAIIGLGLVVAVGAPYVERRLNQGDADAAEASTATRAAASSPEAPPAELPPLRFTEVRLGAAPGPRFAFDRAVAGHVLSCESESHDGGRTWTAGGRRDLCGDPAPMPPPSAVPGAISEWTQDSEGTTYAAVSAPDRRPHLMWAPQVDGPWRTVPTPGDVRGIAVDGARAYVVAEMLGRGHHDAWDWTRWPPSVAVRGVTAAGSTVVAWGRGTWDYRGAYVVSRDAGARVQLVLHGMQPTWAALDPHRPSDLLVATEDRRLTRLQLALD